MGIGNGGSPGGSVYTFGTAMGRVCSIGLVGKVTSGVVRGPAWPQGFGPSLWGHKQGPVLTLGDLCGQW